MGQRLAELVGRAANDADGSQRWWGGAIARAFLDHAEGGGAGPQQRAALAQEDVRRLRHREGLGQRHDQLVELGPQLDEAGRAPQAPLLLPARLVQHLADDAGGHAEEQEGQRPNHGAGAGGGLLEHRQDGTQPEAQGDDGQRQYRCHPMAVQAGTVHPRGPNHGVHQRRAARTHHP